MADINCNFCGLTQASSQPHCAGCGASLPLSTGSAHANEKMLALATQVNTLLSRENARTKRLNRVNQLRIGIGMVCVVSILSAVIVSQTRTRATVIAEHEMMRDRAAQQRYTRVLEMELYNAGDGSLPIEPPR